MITLALYNTIIIIITNPTCLIFQPFPKSTDQLINQSTDQHIQVLVVQSTEDVFVNPRNAAVYQQTQLPPERVLVKDTVDSLDENAVHVMWLKAGHEVIQERSSFLLGLVSNLAQMCT